MKIEYRMLHIAVMIISFMFLIACGEEAVQKEKTPEEVLAESLPGISLEEVAMHNTADDCWLAIREGVYDVTKYIVGHPGGKVMAESCGTFAEKNYLTRPMGSGTPHSKKAQNLLEAYRIGDLENDN